jgi:hypothetical protein
MADPHRSTGIDWGKGGRLADGEPDSKVNVSPLNPYAQRDDEFRPIRFQRYDIGIKPSTALRKFGDIFLRMCACKHRRGTPLWVPRAGTGACPYVFESAWVSGHVSR